MEFRAAALAWVGVGTGATGGREVMKMFVLRLVLESGVCLTADTSVFIYKYNIYYMIVISSFMGTETSRKQEGGRKRGMRFGG